MNKAVFLDRDGVVVKDIDLLTDIKQIIIPSDVPNALLKLKEAGFKLIIVSNQAVVARGLISEKNVENINSEIERQIVELGGPKFDAVYFCPHHPNATLSEYRVECECRKPRTGMLTQAAKEHNIDFTNSFMIGDRITDIIAGKNAGCETILLETGMHREKTIVTVDEIDGNIQPDFKCENLLTAAEWILINNQFSSKEQE